LRSTPLRDHWAVLVLVALSVTACGGSDGGSPPTPAPTPAPLRAFPGAMGSAAVTPGGRGGAVIKVTSLADAGPGTLRECAEVKTGPRTCVFTVAGTIRLHSGLWITQPYLTVAGQTAPGGGILITNADGAVISNLVGLMTHDVIWQYTRLRNQWRAVCSDANGSECGGLMAVFGGRDIIADHNSLSWNQDEGFGVWRGDGPALSHITFSMNLIAEGLASHSTGIIVGASSHGWNDEVTNIDIHHNLVMNNNHRNPLMQNKSGRIVNNIFYNQGYYVNQFGGGGSFDVVGNLYKRGPMTDRAGAHEIQAFSTDAAGIDDAGRDVGSVIGMPSLHLRGNQGWNQPDPAGDQWPLAWRVLTQNGGESAGSAAPAAWKRSAALPAAGVRIVDEPVAAIGAATGSIVPTVGASRRLACDGRWVPNRDAVDARLIGQYLANTGIQALPNDETASGGLPAIDPGTPCADTDDDGLPDAWEIRKFGNLSQGPAADADGDGYTDLEAYLHGL
jgi:pectate lyase